MQDATTGGVTLLEALVPCLRDGEMYVSLKPEPCAIFLIGTEDRVKERFDAHA